MLLSPKRMASSRQKSCGECSKAKRKCDLQMPCSRCMQRSLTCAYTNVPQPPALATNPNLDTDVDRGQKIHAGAASNASFSLETEIVLDPILNTELTGPWNTSIPIATEDTTLDSMAWQQESQVSPSLAGRSNKLSIKEILRTGVDYRRADYHKISVAWDKHTYEAFSDPNSKFSYNLTFIKDFHREFAATCQTPWLHPRLYKDGMPDNVLATFSDCVLYANKNSANKALVYRSIERNVENLLKPKFVDSVEDHLARLHALLLYQSMRLFDTDVRQRSLAEATMAIFEEWTDLMADLRDALSDLEDRPGREPTSWESWIQIESIRRTVISSYSLITIYYLLKQDPHQGNWLRPHPWTLSRHLWEAPSSFDFYCMWRERPHFQVSCLTLDDSLRRGKGEDVDAFGRMMLITYMGLDEVKQWFRDTGSSY